MSSSPAEQALANQNSEPSAPAVELMADELVALIEEFETAIIRGDIPAGFSVRVAEIRETAEGLIDG
jgi:hypothetical protein